MTNSSEQEADDYTGQDSPQETPATAEAVARDAGFRPLTRVERRNIWLKEYDEQDIALQWWARMVEQQDLELEMMFQMHGLLVFGVMVSTARYAQFNIELNEELYREQNPDTADTLRDYYLALVPRPDQPEIGPEGLPVLYRFVHMRDVTIISAGHHIKLAYWRGKFSEIDAFVFGATPNE